MARAAQPRPQTAGETSAEPPLTVSRMSRGIDRRRRRRLRQECRGTRGTAAAPSVAGRASRPRPGSALRPEVPALQRVHRASGSRRWCRLQASPRLRKRWRVGPAMCPPHSLRLHQQRTPESRPGPAGWCPCLVCPLLSPPWKEARQPVRHPDRLRARARQRQRRQRWHSSNSDTVGTVSEVTRLVLRSKCVLLPAAQQRAATPTARELRLANSRKHRNAALSRWNR